MNNYLELYYLLEVQDNYWIAYDLCLENNWADVSTFMLERFMYGQRSGMGGELLYSDRSRAGSDATSYYNPSKSGYFRRSIGYNSAFSEATDTQGYL
jgi:hypothetical protein